MEMHMGLKGDKATVEEDDLASLCPGWSGGDISSNKKIGRWEGW